MRRRPPGPPAPGEATPASGGGSLSAPRLDPRARWLRGDRLRPLAQSVERFKTTRNTFRDERTLTRDANLVSTYSALPTLTAGAIVVGGVTSRLRCVASTSGATLAQSGRAARVSGASGLTMTF